VRYKPSESELVEIESYSEEQRLHYFLSRAIEAEEIWGLGDNTGWLIKEVNDRTIISIWPYETFAAACVPQSGDHQAPVAISLEQFLYAVLPKMDQQNIQIEILPTNGQSGKIMQAQALAAILEGMMESGEYYMEG
jgi:hypothetical protein